jgi:hypothetical protein
MKANGQLHVLVQLPARKRPAVGLPITCTEETRGWPAHYLHGRGPRLACPLYRRLGSPQSNLEAEQQKTISCPCRAFNVDIPSSSPQPRHCTNRTVPVAIASNTNACFSVDVPLIVAFLRVNKTYVKARQ